MVRKIAVPKVPPIERKKAAEAVATPIWEAGTEFWVASTRVCMQQPRPAPSSSISGASVQVAGLGADPGQAQQRHDQERRCR